MKKVIMTLGMLPMAIPVFGQEPADSIGTDLREVVVVSRSANQRIESKRLGAEKLELSKLNTTPALFSYDRRGGC